MSENRFSKLLRLRLVKSRIPKRAPKPRPGEEEIQSVRGAYLGTTPDGWEAYEVNHLALKLPAKPIRPVIQRKQEVNITRTTVANVSQEELRNILHKITSKKKYLL